MTLNITVLSPGRIYQSADFRLAAFKRGPDGKWIPIANNSPKIIALHYGGWNGFLTYCGVGLWDSEQTYDAVARWLVTAEPKDLSFDQVAEVLTTNGSTWIKSICDELGRFQPQTFVLAGFEADQARVAVISNTQSIAGRMPRPANAALQCSLLTTSDIHVLVTGIDNAVHAADRKLLKRLAKAGIEANVLRHHLSRVNVRASRTDEANNGISPACLCYSVDIHGGGSGDLYGTVEGRFAPIRIQRGVNMTALMTDIIGELVGPNAQSRGSTFATTASSNAVAEAHIECTLQFNYDSPAQHWTIADLSQINEIHIEPVAINRHGSIVGQVRHPINTAPRAFVWHGDEIIGLGTLGGPFSSAQAINSDGVLVGSAHRADGVARAVRWSAGTYDMSDLGQLVGDTAVAIAINDHGTIVGTAHGVPGGPNLGSERAFIWTEQDGMQQIDELGDVWTSARAINNNGWIVGSYRLPGQPPYGFVWSRDIGLHVIGASIGRAFFVQSINNANVVLGTGNDEFGVRRVMVWTLDDGLRVLEVPAEYSPVAIDDDGNIIGVRDTAPWFRSWLYRPDGTLVQLPYAEDHSTEVKAIAHGTIIGVARKEDWKHVHPLRWRCVPSSFDETQAGSR